MKLKKLLEINQMCEERKAPFDIQESFEYESSKGELFNILDMDIVYLVRAFKVLERDKKTKELLANNIKNNKIDGKIHWISDQLSSLSKELKEYTDGN